MSAAVTGRTLVSPVEMSSGKTRRHRLNRGGDRQANCALHTIVLARLRWDQRTRDYLDRRITGGIHRPRDLPAHRHTTTHQNRIGGLIDNP